MSFINMGMDKQEPIGILAMQIERKFGMPMSNGQFNRIVDAIERGEYDRLQNLTLEEFRKEFGPIELM